MQLAFYLADKWRNPTIVLTDAIVGQTAEILERKALDLGPLPDKACSGKSPHKKQAMSTSDIACLAKPFPLLEALLRPGDDLILESLVQIYEVGAVSSYPHHQVGIFLRVLLSL